MGLILCLETTTTNCSVALGKDGSLLAVKEEDSKSYSHDRNLHPFIKEILEENQINIKQLDAIAVSRGPGSYTGLRIGVSTAKGLCFSLDKPLIAVDTLEVLYTQIKEKEFDFFTPMLDARRMEVYTAVFDKEGKNPLPTSAKILDANSFKEFLDRGKVLFAGTGTDKFKEICMHPNAFFLETTPSAKEMVTLADNKYKKSGIKDVAYFEPYYLKDFIAK